MFSYVPDFLPSSIVVVGAGGTGSRLMPMLSQLVKTCLRQHNPNAWLEQLPIYVIDADIVEEKNLLRQNFIAKDVGQPKAAVVANRYSAAFGISIHPCLEYISTDNTQMLKFIGADNSTRFSYANSIVIMAVDSADARRAILQSIYNNGYHGLTTSGIESPKCFIIDAGNEDDFGQVRFSTSCILYGNGYKKVYSGKFPNQTLGSKKVNYLPIDPAYYASLGTSAQEKSCADLPQTLAINAMMATLICSIVQNFLFLKPMTYNCSRYSMAGGVSTEFNTPKQWISKAVDFRNDIPDFMRGLGGDISMLDIRSSNSQIIHFYDETVLAYKNAGMRVTDTGEVLPIQVPKPTPMPVTEEITPAKAPVKKSAKSKAEVSADELLVAVEVSSVPTLNPIQTEPVEMDPTTLRPVVRVRRDQPAT